MSACWARALRISTRDFRSLLAARCVFGTADFSFWFTEQVEVVYGRVIFSPWLQEKLDLLHVVFMSNSTHPASCIAFIIAACI